MSSVPGYQPPKSKQVTPLPFRRSKTCQTRRQLARLVLDRVSKVAHSRKGETLNNCWTRRLSLKKTLWTSGAPEESRAVANASAPAVIISFSHIRFSAPHRRWDSSDRFHICSTSSSSFVLVRSRQSKVILSTVSAFRIFSRVLDSISEYSSSTPFERSMRRLKKYLHLAPGL